MDRNDLILATALTVAVAGIGMIAIGTSPYSASLAAWVQAIGVFAAVFLSGLMASWHADKQERARQGRQLASTLAVITKALEAAKTLESGILLTGEGQIKRDPAQTLSVVHEALTPMRIHELPDFELVSMAINIKANIGGMILQILQIDMSRLSLQIPQHIRSKVEHLRRDCEAFVELAETGKWK